MMRLGNRPVWVMRCKPCSNLLLRRSDLAGPSPGSLNAVIEFDRWAPVEELARLAAIEIDFRYVEVATGQVVGFDRSAADSFEHRHDVID